MRDNVKSIQDYLDRLEAYRDKTVVFRGIEQRLEAATNSDAVVLPLHTG